MGGTKWAGYRRFAEAGLLRPDTLTGSGLVADPAVWPFLLRRHAMLATAPFISAVICTGIGRISWRAA